MPFIRGTSSHDQLTGTDEDDTIIGDGGIDRIVGGNGDDIVDGGLDGDFFVAGPGNDTIDGGDEPQNPNSPDTVSYREGTARVVVDLSIGAAEEDGFGFSDVLLNIENVYGTDFDDILIGTSGANTITGEGGNDQINGGGGIDFIGGGDGDDFIELGDSSSPESSTDFNLSRAFGGNGNDTIIGGDLGHELFGGSGDDVLDGGPGDDILHGSSGADVLIGGPGNDFLRALDGDDTLTGGPGSDVFLVWLGQNVITDFNPAEGDVLYLSGLTTISEAELEDVFNSRQASGASTVLTVSDIYQVRLEGITPDEISLEDLFFSSRIFDAVELDETIPEDIVALIHGTRWLPGQTLGYQFTPEISDAQRAIIANAYFDISRFADLTFLEEAGGVFRFNIEENLENALGNAEVVSPPISEIRFLNTEVTRGTILHEIGHSLGLRHPNESADYIPSLHGTPFTRMLGLGTRIAEGFEDYSFLDPTGFLVLDIEALITLYGDSGATFGDDTYTFDTGEFYFEGLHDGGGTDAIQIIDADEEGVSLDLNPRGGLNVGSGNGNTNLETIFTTYLTIIENAVTAGGNDLVIGNDANSKLTGNAGADTLYGMEGNDRLLGGGDDDMLMGGEGADTLVGGAGDDVAEGGTGNDKIFAGSGDVGDDIFAGGAGNDLIAAGAGDDMIVGDSAAASGLSDTITGADGGDTLFGGSGNDTLIGGGWTDSNNNNRYDAGEEHQTGSSSNIAYSGSGNDLLIGDGGADTLGGGLGNDTLNGGGGNDVFYGGKGATDADDVFNGGDGNDIFFGGSGNDLADGDAGADEIFGGGGNDTLNGGTGADSLFGGDGDDQISGGSGGDFFFFANNHGDDTVTDFNASEDTLFLANTTTDFTDLASVQAAATETTVGGTSGLLIDTGGGNSVLLNGVTLSDVGSMNLAL